MITTAMAFYLRPTCQSPDLACGFTKPTVQWAISNGWLFQACGLGLLCLILGGAVLPTLAQEPSSSAEVPAAETVGTSAPVTSEATEPTLPVVTTYTYPGLFSIQVPEGWQVAALDDAPQVVITNFAEATASRPSQAEDVSTEVTWIERPPSEVVPQALQEIEAQGYALVDYGALTIDGATALQLWLANLPEAPNNAVMTYIGYETVTAVIVSRFGTPTPETRMILETLHSSFARLQE